MIDKTTKWFNFIQRFTHEEIARSKQCICSNQWEAGLDIWIIGYLEKLTRYLDIWRSWLDILQAITWVGELPLSGGGKQLFSRGKQEARGKLHISNGSWKIKAEDSKDKTAGWQNSLRDKTMPEKGRILQTAIITSSATRLVLSSSETEIWS